MRLRIQERGAEARLPTGYIAVATYWEICQMSWELNHHGFRK
jgi:hypothetical protein